ncbi:50S ribosomal protein L11 methyltransferase [Desulfatitalea alkaliphila]|uniref:50S ribosomal protein L11 methyltransferase n=1 Tax=Desulfatitalea alkaliphila TaxID=2929485 RepID=A0AA41UKW7_9BACT|nr:50S ribosomal protein L11 methyltransferase [Desulfatitalea alkaliphila]MCJ8500881.1 50S ribosomal protein L11 methyltransferase [Desulfatitalea alkaliphila]
MVENAVKEWLRKYFSHRRQRVTPSELIRELHRRFPAEAPRRFRRLIQQMVDAGELLYTHPFAISHLEWNHSISHLISPRLALVTGNAQVNTPAAVMPLRMQVGGAFGGGDHPTTRLCLTAVDDLLLEIRRAGRVFPRAAVDVGTGTGMLSLAVALLGVARVLALDLDPLACHEAAINVKCNDLQNRILVAAGSLAAVPNRCFDLVMANLRPPTLHCLMPALKTVTRPGGHWVLSGFRPDEGEALQSVLPAGCGCERQLEHLDWGAMVVAVGS